MFKKRRIYLDYASLTPMDKGVLKQINKYSSDEYTNPSSLYTSGVKARKVIEESKAKIAKVIHAHGDEILFNSGGTEGNRLVFEKFLGKEIIISAIEHSSIIKNVDAVHVPVQKDGSIDLDLLKKSITLNTALVSIMYVNNEIGTIQPIHEIVKIVRDFNKKNNTKILVHSDACQAGYLPLYVEKLGIDLMTLDGGKIYGPRGVGMLYVKRGSLKIERAGTENLPAIMGFAYALELLEKTREKENTRIALLKNYFIKELHKINPAIKVNGSLENGSPHILNVYIPNIDNELFLLRLDAKGIEVSTKSACLRDEDESYVLKAIGANSKDAIRFSFGRETVKADLDYAISKISLTLTSFFNTI